MSDELGFQILRSLRRILRGVARHSRQIGRDTGLAVPSLLCLRAIADAPSPADATVIWVATRVQLSKSTTSTLIDKLVKADLVQRERSVRDRRRVELSLTAEGHRKLEGMPRPLEARFLERLAGLDPAERSRILASLEQVVQLMGAQDLDAAPLLVPDSEIG